MNNSTAAPESPTKAPEMNSAAPHAGNGSASASQFGDAIEQVRLASASIVDAVSALRRATTNAAIDKFDEGKEQVKSYEARAEAAVLERPLLYLGIAFAAGWVIAKVTKP